MDRFPRLTLFDAAGHRIPLTLTDQGAAIVRREGIGATSVLAKSEPASSHEPGGPGAAAVAAAGVPVSPPQRARGSERRHRLARASATMAQGPAVDGSPWPKYMVLAASSSILARDS
jgi:hypothetical protein